MGNTRRFNPSRRQRVVGLKEQNKKLVAALGYYQGIAEGLSAQAEAERMQRPPDLDEWIQSVIPDMDEDERAEWDAMSPEIQQAFVEDLGERINLSISAARAVES